MTVDEAITIVARAAIAAIVASASVEDSWESFPEIGEDDWEAVVQRAEELTVPTAAEYEEAYALLSARAESV